MIAKPIAEWQTPWSGEYDPLNYAPNGSWYGRGLPEGVDGPPATIAKMVSAIARGQGRMGGIPPARWELSRELAEELAADAVEKWFMSGLSSSDAMKKIADGMLKVCDVPIVLTPDKTTPAMSDPGCVEFVAAVLGENIAHLEAESRSKNLQTMWATTDYDYLRGVFEKVAQQASLEKEPNIRLGLRPPQEHAGKRNHWVEDRVGNRSVWEWTIGKWFVPGISYLLEPDDIQLSDWKYLGPAEFADVASLMAVLHDKDAEILRLTSCYEQQAEKMRMLQAEVVSWRSLVPEHLRPVTSPLEDRIDQALAKAADIKLPTKDDIIRGPELVCGGFWTIPKLKTTMSDPDVVMKNNLRTFWVQGHLSPGDDGPGALVRSSFGTFAEPDVEASSNGSTPDFDSGNVGSSPSVASKPKGLVVSDWRTFVGKCHIPGGYDDQQKSAAKQDDGPKADYHGPDDAAHRSIHEAAEHLLGGRVTDTKARRGLRDALDKADRPAEGRKASDQAIGRALRFGSQTIGLCEWK